MTVVQQITSGEPHVFVQGNTYYAFIRENKLEIHLELGYSETISSDEECGRALIPCIGTFSEVMFHTSISRRDASIEISGNYKGLIPIFQKFGGPMKSLHRLRNGSMLEIKRVDAQGVGIVFPST